MSTKAYQNHPVLEFLNTSETFKQSKPFALGFREQCFSARPEGMAKTPIRRLLNRKCNSTQYLINQSTGAPRFNFDGTIAGRVEIDHGKHALEILYKRIERPDFLDT